jgi:hypothetical protein
LKLRATASSAAVAVLSTMVVRGRRRPDTLTWPCWRMTRATVTGAPQRARRLAVAGCRSRTRSGPDPSGRRARSPRHRAEGHEDARRPPRRTRPRCGPVPGCSPGPQRARRHPVRVVLDGSAFVFRYEPDGSRPWRPDVVTYAFGRLRDRAGLPGVRLHDLRHVRCHSTARTEDNRRSPGSSQRRNHPRRVLALLGGGGPGGR